MSSFHHMCYTEPNSIFKEADYMYIIFYLNQVICLVVISPQLAWSFLRRHSLVKGLFNQDKGTHIMKLYKSHALHQCTWWHGHAKECVSSNKNIHWSPFVPFCFFWHTHHAKSSFTFWNINILVTRVMVDTLSSSRMLHNLS